MAAGKLKIAMLSVHSCPVGNLGAKDTGGMSVYVREIARELGEQGLHVDVFTRVHDPRDEQIVKLGQNARLIHIVAGEDRDIHKLAVYSYLPDFACNLEGFRRQNHLHYDVVFGHYWLSGWVGQYLQRWWHVPHVLMFHTLGAVKNAIGIGEDEAELRIETERCLVEDCHRIIASTSREKEQLIRYYGALPERVSIVPCGVNLGLFRPMEKDVVKRKLGFGGDKVVLFVGRIEPLKGVESLLVAMTYLQNGHRLRLVIIGGDEHSQHEVQRLQQLSRAIHIEDSVTFLGLVKHEELTDFYSAADVCVVPSYYESFGLVALESLACGTPVVATDIGGLRTIIRQGETGYVVADNTPSHLAEKIALFLSKPSAGMESALSVRESVIRFSWSNIAQAIIEECRLVLAKYSA